jgi:cephalosporin hydroxylase
MTDFTKRNEEIIKEMSQDTTLRETTLSWFKQSSGYEYSYHFMWLGRPIIQFPQDIMAMQEIIWAVKPDLIIETGIAHGGSLIFSASMLELIGKGEVLGIDIDIREHNRVEIEKNLMFKRINMIEGSSTSNDVLNKVKSYVEGKDCILVILDSMHTYDHVLKELELYSKFVTKGSYLIVFDTVIEDMPDDFFEDRPWGKDNNPKMAVRDFLMSNDRFEVDKDMENKLLITVAPDGYLKCVKE